MMDPMSDSAFFTSPQSGASVSQQTFSSDLPPQPQFLQQQMAAMPSTNIITCRLCQDIFSEPVIFPCGHTFCLTCSNEWRKRQRVCPQAGCEKPLGEAVPNLLVKEAVISHQTRKIFEANQQQEIALQMMTALQQQILASATGIVNRPPPMTPCEANGLYDDDIERRGQQWIYARKVVGRESRRSFQTPKNRDSERDWVSLEQTCTGEHQDNMPPIEESPANKLPPLGPKESKQKEVAQPDPPTPRCTRNKTFVRGTGERRTEIHQMPRKAVFSARRSLKAMFSGRPKEIPGRSTEDLALAVRMNHRGMDGVCMGDEQQDESQESTELASHPMNKFMQAKKDKSLWSKTKHIFSSYKTKK